MTPTRLLVRDEEERNEPEKDTREREREFKNIWSLDTHKARTHCKIPFTTVQCR